MTLQTLFDWFFYLTGIAFYVALPIYYAMQVLAERMIESEEC